MVSLVIGIEEEEDEEEDEEGLELSLVKTFELVMMLALVQMSLSFVVKFAKMDICVCVREML